MTWETLINKGLDYFFIFFIFVMELESNILKNIQRT